MNIAGVARDHSYGTHNPPFTILISPYPTGQPAVWKGVLEEISSKMTSIRGRRHPRREHSSATLSIALPNCFSPFESGDKLSNQHDGPLGTKLLIVNTLATITNILKYSKDDMQQILKTVMEAWHPAPTLVLAPVPAPAPALALIVAETPREKLKARFPDVYLGKSHMDCYNFCQ